MKSTEAPALCPACGIGGKIFEEFESPVSAERRRRLDLHLHPVAVHFPAAFATSMFLLSVLRTAGLIEEHTVFTGMSDALVWILPFAAVSAALAGMYDGRLRFKRLGTPHLKKKLVLALCFVLVSFSLLIIQSFVDSARPAHGIIVLLASAVLLGIAFPLGLIGGKLLEAKVRG